MTYDYLVHMTYQVTFKTNFSFIFINLKVKYWNIGTLTYTYQSSILVQINTVNDCRQLKVFLNKNLVFYQIE